MKQEELKEVLRLHKLWLEDSPEGRKADLYGADLCGADLRRADLRGANLSGAYLSRADLCEANLRGANFYRANLSGANLCGAYLSEANFSKTILEGKAFLSFQFEKHSGYYFGLDEITIGCHKYSIKEWLIRFEEIGRKEGYSDAQIKQYGRFIKACAKLYKEQSGRAKG